MDEDDIQIEIKLDPREMDKQLASIESKLKKTLNAALGSNPSGGTDRVTRTLKDQEAAALRLAQAQARLATADGNLSRAQTILSTALAKTTKETVTQIGAQTQLVRVSQQLERATHQSAGAFSSLGSAVVSVRGAFAAVAALGVVALFERIGRTAIDAAVSINKQKSTLIALTGSAEAAEKRFAQLIAISQKAPGLTTSLAATLDAQLRVFDVNVKTIDKLLPVIGKLNAISPLGDPKQFVNNLTQLISRNFDRQDLKELVGQSPIAGQLIKEIFNVDNPTNGEAIRVAAKKLGVTTVERLAEEFVKAGQSNSALRNATESLAGQFEKLQGRIQVALAPIGDEMLRTILPAFRQFVLLLERDLPKITALLRDNRDEFLAVASAIVTMTSQVSQLIGVLGKFQIAENLTTLRLLSVLAVTVAGGPGAGITLGRALVSADEQRARVAAKLPFGVSIDETLGAIRNPAAAARVGRIANVGGGGGGGSRSTRSRFVNDFGLGQTSLLEHEAELARIRLSNQAVAERRQADSTARLEQGRLTRAGLTRDFEESRRAQLQEGRLTRAGLTEDFERRAEAQEKFNAELQRSIALAQEADPAFRFMRGLRGDTDAVANSFERLGQRIGDAFGDFRNLLGSLGAAVKQFFGDLLSATLRTAAASALGPLFGGGGSGGGGILGNLFRTPSFAGDGGLAAPPSISGGGGIGGFLSRIFGGTGGGGAASGPATRPRTVAGAAAAGGKFSLGGLLGGLASAAPLLGLGIGAGFGGQSVGGQILGGVGGTLFGLSASTGFLGAGLLTNPFTAIAGIGLIVGGALLGKAKQRRADEEASGQMLTQALAGIEQLAQAVASGQISNLTEARNIFETNILGTFRQQISGLKTRSVVESRLKNQVNDLRKVFDDRIPPLIAAQQLKLATAATNAANFSRQIPEFATGGTTRGGLAFLHPGEKVLNLQQQSAVRAMAGPGIFERAGVPGPSQNRNFDVGGTMPAGLAPQQPIEITLEAQLVISEKTATGIYVVGGRTSSGRAVTVNNVKVAKINREL